MTLGHLLLFLLCVFSPCPFLVYNIKLCNTKDDLRSCLVNGLPAASYVTHKRQLGSQSVREGFTTHSMKELPIGTLSLTRLHAEYCRKMIHGCAVSFTHDSRSDTLRELSLKGFMYCESGAVSLTHVLHRELPLRADDLIHVQ